MLFRRIFFDDVPWSPYRRTSSALNFFDLRPCLPCSLFGISILLRSITDTAGAIPRDRVPIRHQMLNASAWFLPWPYATCSHGHRGRFCPQVYISFPAAVCSKSQHNPHNHQFEHHYNLALFHLSIYIIMKFTAGLVALLMVALAQTATACYHRKCKTDKHCPFGCICNHTTKVSIPSTCRWLYWSVGLMRTALRTNFSGTRASGWCQCFLRMGSIYFIRMKGTPFLTLIV